MTTCGATGNPDAGGITGAKALPPQSVRPTPCLLSPLHFQLQRRPFGMDSILKSMLEEDPVVSVILRTETLVTKPMAF
jgi:hypothetical protein